MNNGNILNSAQTLELVSAAQQGDSNALSRLVVLASPTVHAQARKIFISTAEHEDLYQEGMFALLNAVKTFKPDRGASFSTYVNLLVRRRLISFAESARRNVLADSVPDSEQSSLTDCSVEETVFREQSYAELVSYINSCLSPREREALKLFLNGFSYAEIAEKTGRTKKSVDGTLQRARKKLRDFERLR